MEDLYRSGTMTSQSLLRKLEEEGERTDTPRPENKRESEEPKRSKRRKSIRSYLNQGILRGHHSLIKTMEAK